MFNQNNRDKTFKELGRIIRYWEEDHNDMYKGYVAPYKDKASFKNLYSFYASLMEFVGADKDSIGCDLGCWLGFPCYLEAASSGGKVIGVEIQKSFTDISLDFQNIVPAKNVAFQYMHEGVAPLETGSMDWVFINQVLCNALPASFANSVREGVRILKPGGVLVIADSNNPYTENVRVRLQETYSLVEIGQGSLSEPFGSNHNARRRMIEQLDETLSKDDASLLARATCYKWGPEIENAVLEYKYNQKVPTSFYNPKSANVPCNPLNGAALGNFTNPYEIAKMVEQNGLKAVITKSLTKAQTTPENLYQSFSDSGSFFVIADKPV